MDSWHPRVPISKAASFQGAANQRGRKWVWIPQALLAVACGAALGVTTAVAQQQTPPPNSAPPSSPVGAQSPNSVQGENPQPSASPQPQSKPAPQNSQGGDTGQF